MNLRVLRFLAIVLVALALVPGGAHLLALPNKIDLPAAEYFTTQAIYRGWALLGVVQFGALAACLALTAVLRRRRAPFALPLLASALIIATLAIFFIWTYPANQATANWTDVPATWPQLRAQWEYSHAVNAVLMFLALCGVTLSALTGRATPAEEG
jgi:hypothetical protein